jgi:hypothetical protein
MIDTVAGQGGYWPVPATRPEAAQEAAADPVPQPVAEQERREEAADARACVWRKAG